MVLHTLLWDPPSVVASSSHASSQCFQLLRTDDWSYYGSCYLSALYRSFTSKYHSLRSKSEVKFTTLRGGKTIMKNAPITSIEAPEVMVTLWSRSSAWYMHASSIRGISHCTTFLPFPSVSFRFLPITNVRSDWFNNVQVNFGWIAWFWPLFLSGVDAHGVGEYPSNAKN